jgi:hypothetical protein
MRFAVGGAGWLVRDRLIPAGTVVDTSLVAWDWLLEMPGYPAGTSRLVWPPPDCAPLDQATYDFMTNVQGYQNVVKRFG